MDTTDIVPHNATTINVEGIDITNTDLFNMIVELKHHIVSLSSTIGGMSTKIAELETEVRAQNMTSVVAPSTNATDLTVKPNHNMEFRTQDMTTTFTKFLEDLPIGRDDLMEIFNAVDYQTGFLEVLKSHIVPDELYKCPLQSSRDSYRTMLFYAYDYTKHPTKSGASGDDEIVDLKWNIISPDKLASKLDIIKKKLMVEFTEWQNENIESLDKSRDFQKIYHTQISKLCGSSLNKLLKQNTAFRKSLYLITQQ